MKSPTLDARRTGPGRRPWVAPVVTPLPRLTELTLQSIPGVDEGPGFGGGSVVIP